MSQERAMTVEFIMRSAQENGPRTSGQRGSPNAEAGLAVPEEAGRAVPEEVAGTEPEEAGWAATRRLRDNSRTVTTIRDQAARRRSRAAEDLVTSGFTWRIWTMISGPHAYPR